MRSWALQDAKARFSDLVRSARRDGPQVVTVRGTEAVVVVPVEEWRRLKPDDGPRNLKEWLLMPEPRFEFDIVRGPLKRREPPDLED